MPASKALAAVLRSPVAIDGGELHVENCEAAAAKVGGSPPKVLARVLACCGPSLSAQLQ